MTDVHCVMINAVCLMHFCNHWFVDQAQDHVDQVRGPRRSGTRTTSIRSKDHVDQVRGPHRSGTGASFSARHDGQSGPWVGCWVWFLGPVLGLGVGSGP